MKSERAFISLFRQELRKALKEPEEVDWPVVVAQPLADPGDEAVLAEFAAGALVGGEPWSIHGVLRMDPKGPPIVGAVNVEHFPLADLEVTGTVLRALPLARIRDKALAWLIPLAIGREAMAGVKEKTPGLGGGFGITPDDVERARQAAEHAGKPKRGRRGHPPEHYRRVAFRYLELLGEGRRDVLVALAAEESERLGRVVPRETVRDWVRKATRLGFLSAGTAGRAEKRPGQNLYRKENDDA